MKPDVSDFQFADLIPLIIGLTLLFIGVYAIVKKMPLASQNQRFEGGGIKFEVSMATFLILLGTVCALSSLIISLLDYQGQIKGIQSELAAMKLEKKNTLEEINKKLLELQEPDIKSTLIIPNENILPNIENLRIEYFVVGDNEPKSAKVFKGVNAFDVVVIFENVNKKTAILKIVLTDDARNITWVYDKIFMPLQPQINLEKK